MSHTKEPWEYGEDCDSEWYVKRAETNEQLAFTVVSAPGIAEANARRIVACVNACKGVSTEWLEANKSIVVLGAPIADRFRAVEQQRDELLAALKRSRLALDRANNQMPSGPICDTIWFGDAETLFDYMDAAIIKAEAV